MCFCIVTTAILLAQKNGLGETVFARTLNTISAKLIGIYRAREVNMNYASLSVATLLIFTYSALYASDTKSTDQNPSNTEQNSNSAGQNAKSESTSSANDEQSAIDAFDIAAGEKHYQKNCRACHGPTAKGLASYPGLAGQTTEYLVERLEVYRSGDKVGPNTMLMRPNAANLSDKDIANIANYLSRTFP